MRLQNVKYVPNNSEFHLRYAGWEKELKLVFERNKFEGIL